MALAPRSGAAAPKAAAPAKAAPAKAAAPAAKASVQPAASTKTELKATTTTVTKTLLENGKIKGEPVVAESIEINPFVTATASTSIGLKFRKNMGNFEGAEISVHVSMPHYVEEAEGAAAQVSERARELLETQFAEFDFDQFKGEIVGGADFAADPEGDAAVIEEETSGEAAEEEGGEMTADWVMEQERDMLVEVITTNELEIDPDDYPDDDDLKSMIVASLFPDEEGAAEEGAAADGDAAAEEASQGYTEEELNAATIDELKEVYADWNIGTFPAYNSKNQAVVKKTVIKKILAHQETMLAAS
jgi:hypothetical protein